MLVVRICRFQDEVMSDAIKSDLKLPVIKIKWSQSEDQSSSLWRVSCLLFTLFDNDPTPWTEG